MYCLFNIDKGKNGFAESRRSIDKHGHQGTIHELVSPGISLGYYNIQSVQAGQVIINNQKPFIQCSYTISGIKNYTINNGQQLAAFSGQDYNYLFLNNQEVTLNWQPNEKLEIYELGISPELFLQYLPEQHPFYNVFQESLQQNIATPMSRFNLPLSRNFCDILRQMTHCPLEGRYKELYVKSKTLELLAFQLEHYEQVTSGNQRASDHKNTLKKEDVERMHHAQHIVINNLDSPCSLIDLAHQVGTNEAYLKKHFKQVFGNTVFGYLQNVKMNKAKEMLTDGKTVAEVADYMGYKYSVHFTRAFKKYFGYPPKEDKR
ncbi:AraC-type DNA-binding protein [Filimonas lacunae]|uniref:AraC-type DNA-binding protein n=1 Tax=Filimonas lacunae TaxID=477680 RepID=A0A173MGG1_9BACT|nr:AraC family transcriptional regulator [Filimonas lacunae]BAV06508.1 transcriptional regulator, AraC family [Filimonas lacunae]SIT27213.1 AraC-type DNA-binding protein [Filimonas lacunae]